MERVSSPKSKREKKYFICQPCSPFNGLFSGSMILTKHWAFLYITWELQVSLCEIDLSLVGGWERHTADLAWKYHTAVAVTKTALCIAQTKELDKCVLHKSHFSPAHQNNAFCRASECMFVYIAGFGRVPWVGHVRRANLVVLCIISVCVRCCKYLYVYLLYMW